MSGEPDHPPAAAAAAKEEDRTDAKEDGFFEQFKAEMRGVAASMRKVLDEKQGLNGLVLGQQVHCYYPCGHIVHGSCSDVYLRASPGGKPICPYCRQPAKVDVMELSSDLSTYTDPDILIVRVDPPSNDENGQ